MPHLFQPISTLPGTALIPSQVAVEGIQETPGQRIVQGRVILGIALNLTHQILPHAACRRNVQSFYRILQLGAGNGIQLSEFWISNKVFRPDDTVCPQRDPPIHPLAGRLK